MTTVPIAPDSRLVPFAPAALRELVVFGAPAAISFVPSRKQRQDRPSIERPAFRASPVERILREEALWRGDGLVLTPNRYPFAREQRILWPDEPRRDPDVAMWRAVCAWVDAANGTALVNNVGAASSIARAHAHLTPDRMPFLAALRERAVPPGAVEVPADVVLVAKDLPCCLLGVRGPAAARARAISQLADQRMTAAWNVVVLPGEAWLFPRRVEAPRPHFPVALGAAEVWGRWCYVDREPFDAATPDMLERAFVEAGCPPL
jgi:hypothetical protein